MKTGKMRRIKSIFKQFLTEPEVSEVRLSCQISPGRGGGLRQRDTGDGRRQGGMPAEMNDYQSWSHVGALAEIVEITYTNSRVRTIF